MKCGLCAHSAHSFQEVSSKQYFECEACGLVFLDPRCHVSPSEELAQYLLHQNSPEDLDYRRFLSPAKDAITRHLPAPASGLDLGCGPGPTLSVMLEESGYSVKNFDKFFFPDSKLLDHDYDFVTCTEVIEHVKDLDAFMCELLRLLKPKGLLVLMTRILRDDVEFATWHYRIDPTHISFLRPRTTEVLAIRYGLTLLERTGQLIVLRKSE